MRKFLMISEHEFFNEENPIYMIRNEGSFLYYQAMCDQRTVMSLKNFTPIAEVYFTENMIVEKFSKEELLKKFNLEKTNEGLTNLFSSLFGINNLESKNKRSYGK